MTRLLAHVLSPAYLYAQNSVPNGRWHIGLSMAAFLLIVLGALAWWLRRRRPVARLARSGPAVAMGGATCGMVALILHVYGIGPASARIWFLSAFACALGGLGLSLPCKRVRRSSVVLVRALALRVDVRDEALPWAIAVALLVVHTAGAASTMRELGPLPAALALAYLSASSVAASLARGRLVMKAQVLTPLMVTWGGVLLRRGLDGGLSISMEAYDAVSFADPWSPLVSPSVVALWGVGWASAVTFASLWRRENLVKAGGFGVGLIGLAAIAWYGWTVARHLSHGAAGSDPFCYLQMASDLATRGTALHAFPLADLARSAGIATWPVVHVGYHPPDAVNLAPTVWPIGWPLALSAAYGLGGEGLALWGAPALWLATAVVTALTSIVLVPEGRHGRGITAATLAGLLLLTSDEGVRRALVPMADAAAALSAVGTLLFLLAAVKTDRTILSGVAGLALAMAYSVRHPLLPLGIGGLAILGVMTPRDRRIAHILAFCSVAMAGAIPDTIYRWRVFGSPLATESAEWHLISVANIGQGVTAMLADGLLRRREFGYLVPMLVAALLGAWYRPQERRASVVVGATLLPPLLFVLSYRAIRYRDLLCLLPWLVLWAAWGAVCTVRWAEQRGTVVDKALAVGVVACMLSARTAPLLCGPGLTQPLGFGHVSHEEQRGLVVLGYALPPRAIVATGLSSGAVERYAGHETVRPASWSRQELAAFLLEAARSDRPVVFLDDGEEMAALIDALREPLGLLCQGTFVLPTFGLGGQALDRDAVLYVMPETPLFP